MKIDVFNILVRPERHPTFWKVDIKQLIIAKYSQLSLTQDETNSSFPLNNKLNTYVAVVRLFKFFQSNNCLDYPN